VSRARCSGWGRKLAQFLKQEIRGPSGGLLGTGKNPFGKKKGEWNKKKNLRHSPREEKN